MLPELVLLQSGRVADGLGSGRVSELSPGVAERVKR